MRWEFSLFGFCLPFAKTKCAKLVIAKMGFAQKGGCAIAVTMASAKIVRRQKILKIFLPECPCRTERDAVGSPVRVVVCRKEMLFVYNELSTENCPPLLVVTSLYPL
jgi:hypothetical protein